VLPKINTFDAEWIDETRLGISRAGDAGFGSSLVTIVDVRAGKEHRIIQVKGASGGVTIDGKENLFCGNGFGTGDDTGMIRAFPADLWKDALAIGREIVFEEEGILVANLLSAASLGFDRTGNLHVGGGNGTGPGNQPDKGYAGVVSKQAITDVLAGGEPVDPNSPPEKLQRLDPDPDVLGNFWYVDANHCREELYLKDFGKSEVLVFKEAT
jgi:hypothetical protein